MRSVVHNLRGNFFRIGLLAGFLMAGHGSLAPAQELSALPPGRGKDLLSAACTQCHTLKPILMLRDGREGWKYYVHEMVLRGAPLLPEEAETMIQYLAENLGPGKNPMPTGVLPSKAAGSAAGGEAKTISLPPGAGKELLESRCTTCHDVGRVISVKRTKAEWEQVTKNMIERGTQVSSEEAQTITSYLSSQFGK